MIEQRNQYILDHQVKPVGGEWVPHPDFAMVRGTWSPVFGVGNGARCELSWRTVDTRNMPLGEAMRMLSRGWEAERVLLATVTT